MKQLFVIYGKPATGKNELVSALVGDYAEYWSGELINKEKGVFCIDDHYTHNEVIDRIIELFKEGFKDFRKFEGTTIYNIRKIIVVRYQNFIKEEVEKIRNEVNDEVLISTFEAKRY